MIAVGREGVRLRRSRYPPRAGLKAASNSRAAPVEIEPDRIGFRARFTPAGVAALRVMAQDRRALDPKQYAHVRDELGIDAIAAVDPGAAA